MSVRWILGAIMLKAALPQLPEPLIANQRYRDIAHFQTHSHRDHRLIA